MTLTRRVNVRAIVFNDGRLLAQTFKTATGESNYWGTPGGGLEAGESLRAGLYREMIEETGIAPSVGNLLFIQQFRDDSREFLEFFFHVKNPADYKTINLATTSHGLIEIGQCDFVDPKKTNLLPGFLQTIDIDAYISGSLPVYISNDLPVGQSK